MFRLIAFYGLPYFTVFVLIFYISWKRAIKPFDSWFIGCSYGGLLLVSFVSNGGSQPPSSFFIFALSGTIISNYHRHLLSQK